MHLGLLTVLCLYGSLFGPGGVFMLGCIVISGTAVMADVKRWALA